VIIVIGAAATFPPPPVIFLTKSVIFMYVTDADDYGVTVPDGVEVRTPPLKIKH
jgi:hypothetical protein